MRCCEVWLVCSTMALTVAVAAGCRDAKRRFGASCGLDSECESGLCYGGRCTKSCQTDNQCPSGVCVANRCDVRTATKADAEATGAKQGDAADTADAPSPTQVQCPAPLYESGGGKCADLRDWAQWPVPSPAPTDAYVVDPNQVTVLDKITGLVWQRDVDAGDFTWVDAKAHCSTLALAGGGWRLPTRIELVSLVDYTMTQPAINADAFPSAPGQWFWSSTPAVMATPSAWDVSFYNGATAIDALDKLNRVRCVR